MLAIFFLNRFRSSSAYPQSVVAVPCCLRFKGGVELSKSGIGPATRPDNCRMRRAVNAGYPFILFFIGGSKLDYNAAATQPPTVPSASRTFITATSFLAVNRIDFTVTWYALALMESCNIVDRVFGGEEGKLLK